MHKRQAIRDQVVSLLNGNTSVGSNVSKNRLIPIDHKNLPFIVVYTAAEDVVEFNKAPRDILRTLSLVIEIAATDTDADTLQDTLDDYADEVEKIMFVDHTLDGTCDDQILQQVELDFNGDGSQPIAMCRMVFAVKYLSNVPESLDEQTDVANIQDFKGANVEYNIGHNNSSPDEQIEAEDTIDVEV